MHFHLPKPLHGWREFAGEVGIIVLGVLIALGAEQAVEDWQWHNKVAIVRKSLIGELANDRARWEVDLAAARCALQDIDKVDVWARGAPGVAAPPIDSLKSGNLFSMHSANWVLATNSLTMDHFPMREQLAFAALYDGIAHRQLDIDAAGGFFDRVETLVPLAANPQARLELREATGGARHEIGALLNNEGYMQRHFDALGIKADRSDFSADLAGTGCNVRRVTTG